MTVFGTGRVRVRAPPRHRPSRRLSCVPLLQALAVPCHPRARARRSRPTDRTRSRRHPLWAAPSRSCPARPHAGLRSPPTTMGVTYYGQSQLCGRLRRVGRPACAAAARSRLLRLQAARRASRSCSSTVRRWAGRGCRAGRGRQSPSLGLRPGRSAASHPNRAVSMGRLACAGRCQLLAHSGAVDGRSLPKARLCPQIFACYCAVLTAEGGGTPKPGDTRPRDGRPTLDG